MATQNNQAVKEQDSWYASNGPVSTMPGHQTAAPEGMMCEQHDDRQAYKRIQGETDTFGCEFFGLCKECYDKYLEERDKPVAGCCDWCKKHSDDLRQHRDFEEGSCGPLYDVCLPCIRKEAAAIAEELGQDERDDDLGDDEPWSDDLDDEINAVIPHSDEQGYIVTSSQQWVEKPFGAPTNNLKLYVATRKCGNMHMLRFTVSVENARQVAKWILADRIGVRKALASVAQQLYATEMDKRYENGLHIIQDENLKDRMFMGLVSVITGLLRPHNHRVGRYQFLGDDLYLIGTTLLRPQ